MTKILYRSSEKGFLECEKTGFKKQLLALFPREFFMFVLLTISNHTVFHVQFEINLHLWVFHKAEIQLFEKLTRANQFQIKREKPYDYLY